MTTFITGANRGLGRALVESYAEAAEPVIGTHRGAMAEGLAALAHGRSCRSRLCGNARLGAGG